MLKETENERKIREINLLTKCKQISLNAEC